MPLSDQALGPVLFAAAAGRLRVTAALVLRAGRLDDALARLPDRRADVRALAAEDPAGGQLPYLAWQVGQLERGAPLDDVVALTTEFHALRPRLPEKDIYRYDTLTSLRSALERTLARAQRVDTRAARTTAAVVYQDENVRVTRPETVEEAVALGEGTRWCVSSRGPRNAFEYHVYGNDAVFFFVECLHSLPKEDADYQKVVIHYTTGEPADSVKYWDAQNEYFLPGSAKFKDWTRALGADALAPALAAALREFLRRPKSRLATALDEGHVSPQRLRTAGHATLAYRVFKKRIRLDRDQQVALAKNTHDPVHELCLKNLNTSFFLPEVEDIITGQANDRRAQETRAIADTLAPPEALRLAQSEYAEVRQRLARNPAAGPEALDWLARHDRDARVRVLVVGNPSVSPDTLVRLAHGDKSADVRLALAESARAVPPEVLDRLARGGGGDGVQSARVRRRVAANKATRPETLDWLAHNDPDALTRELVAMNSGTSVETLAWQAADDVDPSVRTAASLALTSRRARPARR